jgi:hypothetical protein
MLSLAAATAAYGSQIGVCIGAYTCGNTQASGTIYGDLTVATPPGALVQAHGVASLGSLGGYVYTQSGFATQPLIEGLVRSTWGDLLTVTSTTGSVLVFDMLLSGGFVGDVNGSPWTGGGRTQFDVYGPDHAHVQVVGSFVASASGTSTTWTGGSGPGLYSMAIAVNGSRQFVLDAALEVRSSVMNTGCLHSSGSCVDGGTVWSESDFLNTLLFGNFRVYDANGNLVPFTLYGDTGFDYTTLQIQTATVPEPATLLLLGTGLALAMARVRRRTE